MATMDNFSWHLSHGYFQWIIELDMALEFRITNLAMVCWISRNIGVRVWEWW
jgi:hypothetical protein